ncbi:MAG: hypothetical protein PHX51_08270 [Clostridia bacterium]|nr:hypothetical protein [Clostridia bacterium]
MGQYSSTFFEKRIEMPSEVSVFTKLLEVGKDVGAPIAVLFLMFLMWQFLTIFKDFSKGAIEAFTKFLDRHFTHVDNLEKEIQDMNKQLVNNQDKTVQATNALSQAVSILNQLTTQNIQEIKPLVTGVTLLEKAISNCHADNNKRG